MTAFQQNETWEIVDYTTEKKTWLDVIGFILGSTKRTVQLQGLKRDLWQRGILKHTVLIIETVTPIAKLNTVQVLLSRAVNLDCPL